MKDRFDEHGRRVPPPGWEYYTFVDDDGVEWPSANVRRIGPEVVTCEEAWAELVTSMPTFDMSQLVELICVALERGVLTTHTVSRVAVLAVQLHTERQTS